MGALTGLKQSADGQYVVAVTSQGYVYQVDNSTRESTLLHQSHTDSVEYIAYP